MKAPRPLEIQLSDFDRGILRAAGIEAPAVPVVSWEMYQAVIDSNEYITNENFQLRRQVRDLEAELAQPRAWRNRQAVVFGCITAAAMIGLVIAGAIQ